MKIAIPVDNKGMLDTHFGHCRYFTLLKVTDMKIVSEQIIQPPKHEPGVLPIWLVEQEVTDVIAGGLGHKAREILENNGVNVCTGASFEPARMLAEAYVKGTILTKGNLCNH
ncbi:NifB/NifX family molybdenum-iron cluster-binding protein [Saccharicrinis sp. FJH62]|uniref:NifB/NifX family molybdenum-iron cluster-binding protein n=1 Tax=Saccharicrinis sp. FJH62 TaxID=3344657 RepID=UPI0035D41026